MAHPECEDARKFLTEAGIVGVERVWKVIPAGESGTGYEVILFTTTDGRCCEAIVNKNEIEVLEDW